MDTKKPVTLLSRRDGRVLGQESGAATVVGEAVGRCCADVMHCAARPGDPACPGDRLVTLRHKQYSLHCAPIDDRIVSTLYPVGGRGDTGWERLTPRELDVLRHLALGETTSVIADELGITEATVRAHVEHMRVRLGVGTRAALVARGYALGYLS